MLRTLIASLLLTTVAAMPAVAGTVSFDFAHVGNAGNVGELSGDGAFGNGPEAIVGAVSYNYAISKAEVTNAQYIEFLNAVAATDSFGGADSTLYNTNMGSNARGGITRSGAPGGYTYSTKPNMDNKPVNYVSFFDAMRFTNWLHNGQGSGDTETGVYTIGNRVDEVRSADAKFWIPSEDEWYKAAYHDATSGTAGVYFDYATGSNRQPTPATANSLGDISNPGSGVVNYVQRADWNGQDGNVTTVGSAGIASASPYGTFDQNGNVWEWNEAVISSSARGLRGGSWSLDFSDVRADFRFSANPRVEAPSVGFRVATVPEPSTVLLGALATGGLLIRRRGSDHSW